MAEIEYHMITADNASLLDHIETGVYDAPIKADFLEASLANPNQFLVVAVANDVVVGKAQAYVFYFPEKPVEIYIEEIDVAKKWRRQGVASALMNAVGAEGKNVGSWSTGSSPKKAMMERGHCMSELRTMSRRASGMNSTAESEKEPHSFRRSSKGG